MSRKEKTYKEQETEQRLGRKRYLERIVETEEAEKQIEDFLSFGNDDTPIPGDLDEDCPTLR